MRDILGVIGIYVLALLITAICVGLLYGVIGVIFYYVLRLFGIV